MGDGVLCEPIEAAEVVFPATHNHGGVVDNPFAWADDGPEDGAG